MQAKYRKVRPSPIPRCIMGNFKVPGSEQVSDPNHPPYLRTNLKLLLKLLIFNVMIQTGKKTVTVSLVPSALRFA